MVIPPWCRFAFGLASLAIVATLRPAAMSAQRSTATAAPQPVLVTDPTLDTSKHQVSFMVTNKGSGRLLAWSVVLSADGTDDIQVTKDFYAATAIPDASPTEKPLEAGAARSETAAYSPPPGTSAVGVRLLAVVFEDKTAWGDPSTIASIFGQRASDRDALAEWVPRLKQVLMDTHQQEQLSSLIASIDAAPDVPNVIRTLRLDAAQALAATKAGRSDAASRLKGLVTIYDRHYQAAVRHSR